MTARDFAAGADELVAFYRQFESLFKRREQREKFLLYMCGQLSNLERKTIEPMVLALIGANVSVIRGLQHFIGRVGWEITPFLEHVQSRVADWLGEPDGVVIADGSGFPKQGDRSVGVGWQYCGHLGKLANCQEGVFLV